MKKLALLLIALCLALSSEAALAGTISITLSDAGIQCDTQGVFIEGSVVTIVFPGEYIISGSLSNGQIVVDCEYDGKVTLILQGVTIHNETGAAIHIKQCSPRVCIVLADGTENTLTGGTHYVLDADDEPNGVIFSKDDVTIEGTGTLFVTAAYMDGIVSKDDLRIEGGTITVVAARNGIRGKDSVEILDGVLNITAGNDGIKSTNDKEPSKGFVTITNGSIVIRCVDDPISVVTSLSILGGTIDATIDDDL